VKNIINKIISASCADSDIKCKSFNTVSFVVFIIAFTSFVALYIKNIYFQVDDFIIDVGRLLFVSIFSGLAYFIHKKGFLILSKYFLIISFLVFLVYYSIFIDLYDPYVEVLSPLFIIMISVISQIIFYYKKEKIHYYFVIIVLFINLIFYANIYDYYFPNIKLIDDWGNVYIEVVFGFASIFIVINRIVYYILKKYMETQELLTQSNEEIKQNNIELEEKNEELIELKSELIAQNEELKVLDSTKDMFLSVISHDLKNSFNVVNGFSELLDLEYDSYDETKRKYFIKEINSSSNLIYNLLENLLNWSNIKLNGLSKNLSEIIINEFVEEIIKTHNIIAKTKNISLIYQSRNLEKVKVDKYIITTVLGNLINNAIKFSHENSKIEIFTELKKNTLKIIVKDYGIGMNQETLDKLFDIGANRSRKGTNQESGTGLGLILCKEIISKSDGEIWAESEDGKGSTFSFIINVE